LHAKPVVGGHEPDEPLLPGRLQEPRRRPHFHIGLALRVAYLNDRRVPVAPKPAALLPGSWRRWQQAFDTYESGDEAEAFQAVGVHLRECLVSFIGEATDETIVPAAIEPPKGADFKGWADLLANQLASGPSAKHLRAYLKKTSDETWELVNWLTHAKNAVQLDGEIALKAVEHLLGVFTAARMRFERENRRCERCGSYDVRGGRCGHCGWVDDSYTPPPEPEPLDGGGAHRASRGALHAELGHLHVHATAGRRLRSSVPQDSIDLDSEHAAA
jgi:hypothetical protein